MGDHIEGLGLSRLTTREEHFNAGVKSCVSAIGLVIDLLQEQQAKQEGFAYYITAAKIHLADQIRDLCEHRILPRTGESWEEFKLRAAKAIS